MPRSKSIQENNMSLDLLHLVYIVIGIISSLGGLVFAAGYAVSKFREGKNKQTTDVVSSSEQLTTFWKEQVEGFKAIVAEQNEKIRVLTGQIGELKGALEAEKRAGEELKKILALRNPEMESFMKTMIDVSSQAQSFMTGQQQFQKDSHQVSIEIKDFMKSINERLKNVDKDLKIEAKVSKQ